MALKEGRNSSFAKLEDESWGVKVPDGVRRKVKTGDQVEVQKRDGTIRAVTLGEQVAVWNGRDKIFRVDRDNGNGPKPKAQVKTTKAELEQRIEESKRLLGDARKLIVAAWTLLDEVS